MRNYVITTDNTTDMPDAYYTEHKIGLVSLTYTLEGVTYNQRHPLPVSMFYEKMRAGSMPVTSQANAKETCATMEPYLKQGMDILHIAFSSGLSGSFNSSRLAVEELKEKYPEATIITIDSLCASMGEGLLLHKAVMLHEQGASIEENARWIEEHKLNLCHMFTVDNLFHLHRGGRVSKTVAIVGTMLSLKPVMHVDDEGHLTPVKTVRGRKKSLLELVDLMEEKIGSYRDKNDIIFISHGDCENEARSVADMVKKRFGIETFMINYVGPTIGAHSGPGTVALFFMGDQR